MCPHGDNRGQNNEQYKYVIRLQLFILPAPVKYLMTKFPTAKFSPTYELNIQNITWAFYMHSLIQFNLSLLVGIYTSIAQQLVK